MGKRFLKIQSGGRKKLKITRDFQQLKSKNIKKTTIYKKK